MLRKFGHYLLRNDEGSYGNALLTMLHDGIRFGRSAASTNLRVSSDCPSSIFDLRQQIELPNEKQ
ncbi:hypothetical protein [Tardiphaga sp. vice304]|uniref:hypothetical protein n=1 Tax=Tardiphaga sp. vice304 TaxID=2592817 RepID=UPI001AEEC958|nr:hypothetical protein [Tardiphaga sp. vice304]